MTNHINRLMKIAGVGYIIECKHGDEFPENCDCNYPCEECSACIKKYPVFTPEKQIELIKLIAKSDNFQIEVAINQHECVIGVRYYLSNDKIWGCSKHFELALAETAVELLGLGELDKPEVRRILEDD